MTRFARAKGSKASNERVANDATPWHVMKQQLDANKFSGNGKPERAKTAKQLLGEKDEPFYCDTTGNVNNDWAEFDRPGSEKIKKQTVEGKVKSSDARLSRKNSKKLESADSHNVTESVGDSPVGEMEITPKIKSKKRKSDVSVVESTKAVRDSVGEVTVNGEGHDDTVSAKKKSKVRKSDASNVEPAKSAEESIEVGDDTSNQKIMNQTQSVVDAESAGSAKKLIVDNANPDSTDTPNKKSKKRKSQASVTESLEAKDVSTIEESNETGSEPKKKKKNRKKKNLQTPADETVKSSESSLENNETEKKKIDVTDSSSVKMSKRQKRNQKRKNKIASVAGIADGVTSAESSKEPITGSFNVAGNEWSSNVNFGKKVPNKSDDSINEKTNCDVKNFKKPSNPTNGDENKAAKRKAPKIRDDKEHKRRKPDVGSIKCTINGTDVEIVKYDGFPVKKEDAERLKDLRRQMIIKGIPKSEINAAMKLERRKSEKSLARMRKQVCFHCRKAGHNLSDCPELGEGESATGICFKCGSTEHTHFECKVTKKLEYGFASCFICREQGHIAKQCPDNPKGLYPQGGSCKICGDVTHLRKDCPDATRDKEENAMTIGTMEENNLESLDEDKKVLPSSEDVKKNVGKIVKF